MKKRTKTTTKPVTPKKVEPPGNYRDMVDKNVNIAKVAVDILDLYLGSFSSIVTNNKEK